MAMNETLGCSSENLFLNEFQCLAILITVVTVCQSTLVIYIIWKTAALHTNTNILVASSTMTGIIICLAYDVAVIPYFHTNNIIGNVVYGIACGTVITSIIHMGIIAIDQYIYIVHPFYYMRHMTRRLIFKVLLATWITGLAYMAFPSLVHVYYKNCTFFSRSPEYYWIGTSIYTVNIIIIFVCYLKIAFLAFHHKKTANARRLQTGDPESARVIKNNFKIAFRSVKYFVIMFGIFAFCSLPQVVIHGFNMFYSLPNYLLTTMLFLLPLISVMDVLIYMIMNRAFSKALKVTFLNVRQKCCKQKEEFTNRSQALKVTFF